MTDLPPPDYSGPDRVLSGVQPSGALHLGNYLGAVKKFVDLQNRMECLFCVVDLHAITDWQSPEELAAQTRAIAAAYLAAGVDPDKAIIFPQSAVSAHAELAWIFQCVARIGWLDRMTQFKDKSGKNKERVSVGLYTYPVLQAADILVYRATHVPVGEDQKQHLELTRDIAQKFNHDFAAPGFFPLPEALIEGANTMSLVMSLRDGRVKMSKSDPSDQSRINLTDDADTIAAKIRKARTDPAPLPESVEGLKDRPEAENLVGLYAALSGRTEADVLKEYGGQGFGQSFKPALAELLIQTLSPMAAEMSRFAADPAEIDRILAAGAEKARSLAEPVIAETKCLVGFWAPKA
ncbi:MAG TPA: tryptophan--tRNA ligase [Caulobacteraceae bacterium]